MPPGRKGRHSILSIKLESTPLSPFKSGCGKIPLHTTKNFRLCSDQTMQSRFPPFNDFENRFCHRLWSRRFLLKIAKSIEGALPPRIIFRQMCGCRMSLIGHSWLEISRLCQRYVNIEWAHFHAQCLGEAFEGEFARRIDPHERNRRDAGKRGDVNNLPLLVLPHQRQNCLHHFDDAEEISLELGPGLV